MPGTDRLNVIGISDGERLRLFRVVRGSDPSEESVVASFKSNYELGRPPRNWERRSAVVQMGLSMFVLESQAEATAVRFPAIGDHVAELDLPGARGFALAETGASGHRTVWGRPLDFIEQIVEIRPISSQ